MTKTVRIESIRFGYLAILFAGILSLHAGSLFAQSIDFGKSYINVTKGLNGGTIEPGDTLEIRASVVVRSGVYDSMRFTDVVPTGTVYLAGTIRVLTNEGKVYKQFTDAALDDPGQIVGSNITINMGYNATDVPATAFRRGRIRNTHKPSFYSSTCIMIASYQVRITAGLGSTVSTGGGTITYRPNPGLLTSYSFPSNTLAIYTNYGVCSNAIGVNALGTEFNGSFGSGPTRNRGTSGNVPPGYSYTIFTTGTPNDYSYGIANNTSTQFGYSTINTWNKPDPDPDGGGPLTTHRVFSVWDIIGDHTGAANPVLGNNPADTVANNNGGYMLIVNAAYRIDSAFQQTISGLCPNTYYEISCWMRNICSKCGCDSNGKGASNGSGPVFYIPTGTGDSSGVAPNITFEVNGLDYYTTGNLSYSGQWVKKGFTYLTGPLETSINLKFFNNAPGGGGNDWALDDITVATCSPELQLNPSPNPFICQDNLVEIGATVYSFFNNYTYYKWQKSTDNGASWSETGVSGGPETPVWNGSNWEYTVDYPSFVGVATDSGDQYRLVIATTSSNLSDDDCAFSDPVVITLTVEDCMILPIELLSFTGKLAQGLVNLHWITTPEEEPVTYTVERSSDGNRFAAIHVLPGQQQTSGNNEYSFTDPQPLSGTAYYRLRMETAGGHKYSKVLVFNHVSSGLSFGPMPNPFTGSLRVELNSAANTTAHLLLVDPLGRTLVKTQTTLTAGRNAIDLPSTQSIPNGIYTIQVITNDQKISRKIVKAGN